MLGIEKEAAGPVVMSDHFRVMKKILTEGDVIPPHNHPGHQMVFTVVKGTFEITLNGEETHTLTPGKILAFDGAASLAGRALTDTEFTVTKILF